MFKCGLSYLFLFFEVFVSFGMLVTSKDFIVYEKLVFLLAYAVVYCKLSNCLIVVGFNFWYLWKITLLSTAWFSTAIFGDRQLATGDCI